MKQLLLLWVMLNLFLGRGNTQEILHAKAYEWIVANRQPIGLHDENIINSVITNAYHSSSSGIDLVYLQQTYKGLPVFNQLMTLAFRNGMICSQNGYFIQDISNQVNVWSVLPKIKADQALAALMKLNNRQLSTAINAATLVPGRKYNLGTVQVSQTPIIAELMWVPVEKTGQVILCWQLDWSPLHTSDHWLTRLNAQNGQLVSQNNLTVYCDWGHNIDTHTHGADFVLKQRKNKAKLFSPGHDFFDWSNKSINQSASPSIINGATYRVVPFPYESPRHFPLQSGLVADPWTSAPGNATNLKWHSTGTSDYNYTRGNNVWAQEDANGNNGTGASATSTTGDPLTFNFTPNFTLPPTQTIIAPNRQFNITNLFYWNNIIHDITYRYGFDEVAGNFQSNNQGRGGIGNDYVLADAQDGSGTNNANFSTPADGGSGRMQMYLWNPATIFNVNAPSGIAGSYQAVESNFSTGNKLVNIGSVTGTVVIYNDNATGTLHEACVAPVNTLTGKIALIDRGNCNFSVKVKNAQIAGAIAAIVVNNDATAPIIMGGTDNTVTIPAIMISQSDGLLIRNQLANNVNVTMSSGEYIDGDVDNGVIVHEYSHGISNRLTGGPSQASCLGNAEQMGEGWSDYIGLMLTQDWANANVNTGFTQPRGIGTYVFGQTPSQSGIRSQKYCTDFNVNNKVYASTIPSEIHDLGEIWCATLWDMTWNIIQQTNSINADIYDTTSDAGNSIALKLVMEGMKLQPCSPGFIDGRNAILKADSLLYGGAYSCSIREAFRRRGMGINASQGTSSSVSDQTADYTPLISLVKSENISQASEGQQVTYTTVINSCSPLSNYTIRDTLPSNVTYVSGGTYDAVNRVVSFPVNLPNAGGQSYSFTVSINSGSYFSPLTYIEESVGSSTLPAAFTATSSTTNTWTVSATQSHSAPNSLFTPNAAVASDQKLETSNAIALGTGTASLSFYSRYITQSGVDGAVVELSTNNGTSWSDITNNITAGYYNSTLSTGSGNPLAGRRAWSGNNGSFFKTSINLSSYAGQAIKLRFRLGSSNTIGSSGWYIDDIAVKGEPVVNIRSNLFNSTNNRVAYSDTVTQIIETVVCNPVAVNAQPQTLNACEGGSATFNVTADGTNPAYQWQLSTDGGTTWTDIPGANGPNYTIAAVNSSMNSHRFRVLLSNTCPSSVTSVAALLFVTNPANIITQPFDQTVCSGETVTFSATASGNSNTYQWQVSTDGGTTWTDIPGAVNTTFTINAVSTSMANYRYRLVVFSCGSTGLNTTSAVLQVNNVTQINAQPSNAIVCEGSNVTLTATATGNNLSYQWEYSTDGGNSYIPITGANTNSLSINNISISQSGYLYHLVISGDCGPQQISVAASITVNQEASIITQPVPASGCSGSNINFTVVAIGPSLNYQWQSSSDGGNTWNNINGATTATLQVNNLILSQNNWLYRVLVGSGCAAQASTSNNASLTVWPSISFTQQPADFRGCAGTDAYFTTILTGTVSGYQWQISADGGNSWNNITGANNASLLVTNITAAMNQNRFRVLVDALPCGNISATAILTVTPSPVVSLTASPYLQLFPGLSTTLTASANPPATGFNWYKNGAIIPGINSDRLAITYDDLGEYSVEAQNGCSNRSNILSITDSVTSAIFIYPNPNQGVFYLQFYGNQSGIKYQLAVFDVKGARVAQQELISLPGYQKYAIHLPVLASGNYLLKLFDNLGNSIKSSKLLIQ